MDSYSGIQEPSKAKSFSKNALTGYSEHTRIFIMNDTDFSILATAENWGGNGSAASPNIIDGYNITSSSGNLVEIHNTTFYFEIRNTVLDGLTGSPNGIYFENVSHASLVNVNIINNEYGIVLGY